MDQYDKLSNHPQLKWVSRLSYLMDEQFRLPGTKYRFGIDPVINLIPFAGDLTGFLISGGMVLAMANKGASSKIVVLMCLNILLDATIGAIPVIGQIFDFFFKANSRNLKLIKEHYLENKHQGSGKGIIIWTLIILFLIMALLIYALWNIGEWLVSYF